MSDDDELEWYEALDYLSTCDEKTGSQTLPTTDLNQLRWDAGDLLEFGIEMHIAECKGRRPECRHRWPRRLTRLRREHQRSYVLRQRYPDGMGPPWGYCITRDALHGFLRGIHFGAAEHHERTDQTSRNTARSRISLKGPETGEMNDR